jgi:hypothetical protein
MELDITFLREITFETIQQYDLGNTNAVQVLFISSCDIRHLRKV